MPDPDPTTGEIQPEPSRLVAAVCEVMKEVTFVQKTGYNPKHKYRYASDADLAAPLQAAMAKHGLMMAPVEIKQDWREWKSPGGADGWLVTVTVTYALRHVDGETMLVVAAGSAWNNMDKALYSAQTGALKYAHRGSFTIPTGDDAERDVGHQAGPRQPSGQAPPKVDPADLDRVRKLWFARLKALVDANLIPQLQDEERHLVQQECMGVRSINDLSAEGCAYQLAELPNVEDRRLAGIIRDILGMG